MASDDHEQHLRRRIEELEAELEEWRGLIRVCGDFLRRVGSPRLSVSDARVRLQAAMEGRLTVVPTPIDGLPEDRDRNARIDDAQRAVQRGDLASAITMYRALVQTYPEDTRFRLKLGDCYARVGDITNATATYLVVAQQYEAQGFFLKAIAVYKQILKVYGHSPMDATEADRPNPLVADVFHALAGLYERLHLLGDALLALEEFLNYAGGTDERIASVRERLSNLQRS